MKKKVLIIILCAVAIVGAVIFFIVRQSVAPALKSQQFTDDLLAGRDVAVKPPEEITIGLVGDIMLSRNVADKIKKAGDPDLPFLNAASFLSYTDFNFGNLESPFSGSDKYNSSPSLVFNVPLANIKGLHDFNFRIVSLANNHMLDQGVKGLEFTLNYLNESNVKTVGAGNNLDAAWQPQIINIKDQKIAFLAASYASANDGGKTRNNYVARIEDLDKLKSKIQNLKSQADLIIVAMHAGVEYTNKPNQQQIDFAHAAIDAGADVVVGSHPHWVQPIEVYTPTLTSPLKGEENNSSSPPLVGGAREGGHTGLIFYSLGNFVFDQEWSQKTKEGLAVKLKILNGKLQTAELLPIIIENYCCARLANDQETMRVLNGIGAQKIISLTGI